jgi:hypothetical protein
MAVHRLPNRLVIFLFIVAAVLVAAAPRTQDKIDILSAA